MIAPLTEPVRALPTAAAVAETARHPRAVFLPAPSRGQGGDHGPARPADGAPVTDGRRWSAGEHARFLVREAGLPRHTVAARLGMTVAHVSACAGPNPPASAVGPVRAGTDPFVL